MGCSQRGDLLVGAGPDNLVVADSTSVNLTQVNYRTGRAELHRS